MEERGDRSLCIKERRLELASGGENGRLDEEADARRAD
ncbi:hypothetical protein TIFTF001_044479 [Ficus carica]|uniref:Uncharacterized protein n=1 Tax=Ficus carica TaxID=3494 RepID=A0AA88CU76_FICCA|nr:hypothetical protein TIFTF001_044479 [Ficus carica]